MRLHEKINSDSRVIILFYLLLILYGLLIICLQLDNSKIPNSRCGVWNAKHTLSDTVYTIHNSWTTLRKNTVANVASVLDNIIDVNSNSIHFFYSGHMLPSILFSE